MESGRIRVCPPPGPTRFLDGACPDQGGQGGQGGQMRASAPRTERPCSAGPCSRSRAGPAPLRPGPSAPSAPLGAASRGRRPRAFSEAATGAGPGATALCSERSGPSPSPSLSALMLAVLRLYEHRTNTDMWSFLLEPLRNLVPCEEVKIVVRCIAPPQVSSLGAHDREARRRVIAVTTVDRWPPERIEGHAALTQRIQVIPSHEAVRRNWDRYEVVQSHCDSPSAGRATCRACNVGGGLRCLAAVPLFDAGGNVLAVAKFVNRRLWSPDGQQQPSLEFSQLDLTMLSAFSAIFACVAPHPFLPLLGTGQLHRPQVKLFLGDYQMKVTLRWQVPVELRGQLCHEVCFGVVQHEDEFLGFAGPGRSQAHEELQMVPCGYLEPLEEDGAEASELTFEFEVPILHAGPDYAFSVRCRNQQMALDWSEPSMRVSTCLVPPYPEREGLRLTPLSESAVLLEWVPFRTCGELLLVEYRVVAQASQGQAGMQSPNGRSSEDLEPEELGEQVVACFVSDGKKQWEMTTVSYLQPNVSYSFAVEARYPHVGPRDFSRALRSESFCSPTADITLPAPQPLALDSASPVEVAGPGEAPQAPSPPLLLRWPYPKELSSQLVLQYRAATAAALNRFQVSMWNTVPANASVEARLRLQANGDPERLQLRLLRLNCECTALQLRVLMTQGRGRAASPPSAWFSPKPPSRPQGLELQLRPEAHGLSLHCRWEQPLQIRGPVDEDLGPVAYAVQHDFSRGNGIQATRFQVRLRWADQSTWEVLQPQLMPRPHGGSKDESMQAYDWIFRDPSWLLRPGARLEVQMRHSNAILWSSWSSSSSILVSVAPPRPTGALFLEEVSEYSATLCWPRCSPGESSLAMLDYWILCAESSSRLEWQTVGFLQDKEDVPELVCDAEGRNPATDVLRYAVHFLRPEKCYHFAVECRYSALPSLLAASATLRLEGEEATLRSRLPMRKPSVSVVEARSELRPGPGEAWHEP
ncbi:unnamed protein product [Symbiodinium microadriaticum]|nr:unnamed protein product [Symbiodinium microadriaticum]